MIKRILHYTRVWYHLLLSNEKKHSIVWEYLKKYHTEERLNSGFFENEKRIESDFKITDDYHARFLYALHQGVLYSRCKIIQDFDPELTTEIFLLATHFNNLLKYGKVIIEPSERTVEFAIDSSMTEYLVYPGALQQVTIMHYETTKDVYWAFQKLINEQEEPAIIIADLIRAKDKSKNIL
jgi:hypothetical protein